MQLIHVRFSWWAQLLFVMRCHPNKLLNAHIRVILKITAKITMPLRTFVLLPLKQVERTRLNGRDVVERRKCYVLALPLTYKNSGWLWLGYSALLSDGKPKNASICIWMTRYVSRCGRCLNDYRCWDVLISSIAFSSSWGQLNSDGV
jgi:hypothetical protein